jgi:hypothetical protein
MKQDNLLANHLNNFKENIPLEEEKDQITNQSLSDLIMFNIVAVAILITRVIVFGYSLKILFNSNWNFIETICIGAGLTFALTYISDFLSIFKKK